MSEAVFAQVAGDHRRCFWLDGGGAREWSGRRSVLGWLEDTDVSLSYDAGRREVTRHSDGRAEVVGDDVFAVLERELTDGGQWFGYLGYACRPDLPARTDPDLPDAVWMRPSHVRLLSTQPVERVAGPAPAPGSAVPDSYRHAFEEVQAELRRGNSYEVNLTYREGVRSDLDPVSAYVRLRALNPAPYAGFLQHDVDGARAWLLSSSPERYALVGADRTIEAKPMKGTLPLAEDPARLTSDPKLRAENLMITDLLRNDLSMVCEPGTVEVPELMAVETYATVHQLVTTIRGRLRDGVSTVSALRALFPAGSMTGAPKLRTMQVIEAVEDSPRGVYAGAFGWISGDGRADLGVVIRSLFRTGGGPWLLGTGGGITVHSDVDQEWAETRWKASALRAALAPEP